MAKVYEFPTKRTLPEEVVECLHITAKAYVETLNYTLDKMASGEPSRDEFDEIQGLVVAVYKEGIAKAIKELEEKS